MVRSYKCQIKRTLNTSGSILHCSSSACIESRHTSEQLVLFLNQFRVVKWNHWRDLRRWSVAQNPLCCGSFGHLTKARALRDAEGFKWMTNQQRKFHHPRWLAASKRNACIVCVCVHVITFSESSRKNHTLHSLDILVQYLDGFSNAVAFTWLKDFSLSIVTRPVVACKSCHCNLLPAARRIASTRHLQQGSRNCNWGGPTCCQS